MTDTNPTEFETYKDAEEYVQGLVDKAYEKWRESEMSYPGFIESLDRRHQGAVVIGNLNGQVCNGGFEQWYENGYVDVVSHVRWFLGAIDTDASKEALRLLREFLRAYKRYEEKAKRYHSREIYFNGDEFDTPYYAIDNQLILDLANYLKKLD